MPHRRHRCSFCAAVYAASVRFCPQDGHELTPCTVADPLLGATVDLGGARGTAHVVATIGVGFYKGWDTALERSLHLALLPSSEPEVWRARAALSSPFISPLLGVIEGPDGRNFLVTAGSETTLADLSTRRSLLASGGFGHTLWSLCHALAQAHRVQHVHGGLGLRAIGLEAAPFARVDGFVVQPSSTLTGPPRRAGFIAPEAFGGAAPTPASDVFSAAAIALWCLEDAVEDGSDGAAPYIPGLDRTVLERAVSTAPQERPTAAELLEALSSAGYGLRSPSQPSSLKKQVTEALRALQRGDAMGCLALLENLQASNVEGLAAKLALQARASFHGGAAPDGRRYLAQLAKLLPIEGPWSDFVDAQRNHALLAQGTSTDMTGAAGTRPSTNSLARVFRSGRDLLAGRVEAVRSETGARHAGLRDGADATDRSEQVFHAVLDAALGTLAGDTSAVTVDLQRAVTLAVDHELWVAADIAQSAQNLFCALLGLPRPPTPRAERPAHTAINADIFGAFDRYWESDQHGVRSDSPAAEAMAHSALARALIEWFAGRSELACGDVERAFGRLESLHRQMGDDGWELVANLCAIDLVVAAAAVGDVDTCHKALEQLAVFAQREQTPLLLDIVEVLGAAYGRRDLSVLVKWCGRSSPASQYARAVVLGDPRRAYFHAFRRGFQGRWPQARLAAVGEPRWAFDGVSVMTGSARASLTSMNARLMRTLCQSGGVADKDAMVRTTWGIATYDPARDDNRLHVAVKRLRVQLRPLDLEGLVVTTATGYALNAELGYVALLTAERPQEGAALKGKGS